MKILCCWSSSLILLFVLLAIYQEILNLTMSNSRLGEDCKELVKSELILLTDTADRLLRKLRVVSADDWFLRTDRDPTDRYKPWIELLYFRTRYIEYLLLVSNYLFRVRKARVSTSI